MTSRSTEEELRRAAYDVAEGYRCGQWPHLRRMAWGEAWSFLIAELERRAPGHHGDDYARALDQGFADSR